MNYQQGSLNSSLSSINMKSFVLNLRAHMLYNVTSEEIKGHNLDRSGCSGHNVFFNISQAPTERNLKRWQNISLLKNYGSFTRYLPVLGVRKIVNLF